MATYLTTSVIWCILVVLQLYYRSVDAVTSCSSCSAACYPSGATFTCATLCPGTYLYEVFPANLCYSTCPAGTLYSIQDVTTLGVAYYGLYGIPCYSSCGAAPTGTYGTQYGVNAVSVPSLQYDCYSSCPAAAPLQIYTTLTCAHLCSDISDYAYPGTSFCVAGCGQLYGYNGLFYPYEIVGAGTDYMCYAACPSNAPWLIPSTFQCYTAGCPVSAPYYDTGTTLCSTACATSPSHNVFYASGTYVCYSGCPASAPYYVNFGDPIVCYTACPAQYPFVYAYINNGIAVGICYASCPTGTQIVGNYCLSCSVYNGNQQGCISSLVPYCTYSTATSTCSFATAPLHRWTFEQGPSAPGQLWSAQFTGFEDATAAWCTLNGASPANAIVDGSLYEIPYTLGNDNFAYATCTDGGRVIAKTVIVWYTIVDLNENAFIVYMQNPGPWTGDFVEYNLDGTKTFKLFSSVNGEAYPPASAYTNVIPESVANVPIKITTVFGLDNSITIYRNDVLYVQYNIGGIIVYETLGSMYVTMDYFNSGYLHEMQIHNTSLTASQAAQLTPTIWHCSYYGVNQTACLASFYPVCVFDTVRGFCQPAPDQQWTFNEPALCTGTTCTSMDYGPYDVLIYALVSETYSNGQITVNQQTTYFSTGANAAGDSISARTQVFWVSLNPVIQNADVMCIYSQTTSECIQNVGGYWSLSSPYTTYTQTYYNFAVESTPGLLIQIAAVYKSDGTISLYRFGVLMLTYTSSAGLLTYSSFRYYALGQGYACSLSTTSTCRMMATFDEARVYSYALDADEVSALRLYQIPCSSYTVNGSIACTSAYTNGYCTWNAALSQCSNALLHQWTFNDGTANDAISMNSAWAWSFGCCGTPTFSNGALNMQGFYAVVVGSPPSPTVYAQTIVLWVSLNTLTQSTTLIDIQPNTYADSNGIAYNSDGTWNASQTASNYPTTHRRSPVEWLIGTLIQIAGVFADDGSVTVYRNGVLVYTALSFVGLQTYSPTYYVFLGEAHGCATASCQFNGTVSEIRFYSGAMGSPQLSALRLYNLPCSNYTSIGASQCVTLGRFCSWISNQCVINLLHQWTFNNNTMIDTVGSCPLIGQSQPSYAYLHGQIQLTQQTRYLNTLVGCSSALIRARTIIIWLTLPILQQAAVVFGTYGSNQNEFIQLNSNGAWGVSSTISGAYPIYSTGAPETQANISVQIAVVYTEDGSVTLYRNAIMQFTFLSNGGVIQTNAAYYYTVGQFGCSPSAAQNCNITANINEIRIYSGALNSSDIAALNPVVQTCGTFTNCTYCAYGLGGIGQSECVSVCPSPAPLTNGGNPSDNTCYTQCPSTQPLLSGTKCYSVCPSNNPYKSNTTCGTSCSTPLVYNSNFTCYATCPSGAQFVNGTSCYTTCSSINLYASGLQCVASCSGVNPYLAGSTCVNVCPTTYPMLDNSTCLVNCSLTEPYTYFNTCVRACSTPRALLSGVVCVSNCTSPNPYLYSNMCLSTCPPQSPYSFGYTCTPSCFTTYGLLLNGTTCVSQCPSQYPYSLSNVCTSSCPISAPLISGSICVQTCPSNIPLMLANNTCTGVCPPQVKFIYNSMCMSTCPSIAPYSLVNNTCVSTCPSSAPYLNGTLCLTVCPSDFSYNSNWTCVSSCPANNPYLTDPSCYYTCPSISPLVDPVCVSSCPSASPLIQLGGCVVNCPINYPVTYGNICEIACPPQAPYAIETIVQNGFIGGSSSFSCITQCPLSAPYTYYNLDGALDNTLVQGPRCVAQCGFDAPYLSQGVCVATCPFEYPYIMDTNVCTNICPLDAPYINDSWCLAQCPLHVMFVIKGESMAGFLCSNSCPDENSFAYRMMCLPSCPYNTYMLAASSVDFLCLDECPMGAPYMVNETCYYECPSSVPLVYEYNCYSECPPEAPYTQDTSCVSLCDTPYTLVNQTCIFYFPSSSAMSYSSSSSSSSSSTAPVYSSSSSSTTPSYSSSSSSVDHSSSSTVSSSAQSSTSVSSSVSSSIYSSSLLSSSSSSSSSVPISSSVVSSTGVSSSISSSSSVPISSSIVSSTSISSSSLYSSSVSSSSSAVSSSVRSSSSSSTASSGPTAYSMVWGFGNTYTPLNVNIGDTVTFNFATGSHNVNLLASLSAFTNCVLTGDTLLSSSGPYTYTVVSLPAYIACSFPGHCGAGVKIELLQSVSNTYSSSSSSSTGSSSTGSTGTVQGDILPDTVMPSANAPVSSSSSSTASNSSDPTWPIQSSSTATIVDEDVESGGSSTGIATTVPDSSSGSSLSTGAIIGIVIGGCAIVFVTMYLINASRNPSGYAHPTRALQQNP